MNYVYYVNVNVFTWKVSHDIHEKYSVLCFHGSLVSRLDGIAIHPFYGECVTIVDVIGMIIYVK